MLPSAPGPHPSAAAAVHAEPEDRQTAVDAWHRYWADRSPELGQYLAALAEIEKTSTVTVQELEQLKQAYGSRLRALYKLSRTGGFALAVLS